MILNTVSLVLMLIILIGVLFPFNAKRNYLIFHSITSFIATCLFGFMAVMENGLSDTLLTVTWGILFVINAAIWMWSSTAKPAQQKE